MSRSFVKTAFNVAAILCVTYAIGSHATAGTVYVGDYGSNQVLRFDDTGSSNPSPIAPTPWITGLTSEGISCLMDVPGANPHVLYVANPSTGNIELVDESKDTNPVINSKFITGLSGVANIKLSNDGHILYVAQESGNKISEYNSLTGALIKSVTFTGAHDLVIGKDGSVYATAYGSSLPASQGVVKFSADLSTSSQFIAVGDNGLKHATGMAFDNAGNFWVGNAGTIRHDGTSFVSEYTSTGAFIRTISDSNILNPFGLSNAGDGTIGIASFGTSGQADGQIVKVNTTTGVVSQFILPGTAVGDAGLNPKYATFEADCVTYSAVPEPSSFALLALGGIGVAIASYRRRNPVGN